MACCGFCVPGVARRLFFLTSLPVAHNVHNSRVEFSEVVCTNHGLHTADLAASGTNQDLGLGVQLVVLHPELVLLQRQLPRQPLLQPRRRSQKQRSVAPLTSVVPQRPK